MEPAKNIDIIEINKKIEILSTDDEKIKLIGNLLSNDTSRKILKLLFEQEMTANEIAQKTEMLLSLVIFHLQKMQDAGIVAVNKVGKNSKGHDMKYYGTTKIAVIILSPKISDKAKKTKYLHDALSKIYKFVAIGIAGITSLIVLNMITYPISAGMASQNPQSISFAVIISLLIIIIGLIIERVIVEIRK